MTRRCFSWTGLRLGARTAALCLAATVALGATNPAAAQTAGRTYIVNDPFEGGINGDWLLDSLITGRWDIVSSPSWSGNCVKMTLYGGDRANHLNEYPDDSAPDGWKARAELKWNPVHPTNTKTERWYYFDLYIPGNWPVDGRKEDLVCQFFAGSGQPSIPLYFAIKGTTFTIHGGRFSPSTLYQETLQKSRWQRFYFHIKWTHNDPGYGLILIKRSFDKTNYTTLVDKTGVNTYDTGHQGFFKFGHYLGNGWINSDKPRIDKVLYFDNVRIERPSSGP